MAALRFIGPVLSHPYIGQHALVVYIIALTMTRLVSLRRISESLCSRVLGICYLRRASHFRGPGYQPLCFEALRKDAILSLSYMIVTLDVVLALHIIEN